MQWKKMLSWCCSVRQLMLQYYSAEYAVMVSLCCSNSQLMLQSADAELLKSAYAEVSWCCSSLMLQSADAAFSWCCLVSWCFIVSSCQLEYLFPDVWQLVFPPTNNFPEDCCNTTWFPAAFSLIENLTLLYPFRGTNIYRQLLQRWTQENCLSPRQRLRGNATYCMY